MDRVNTSLTIINETDIRGKALRDLINKYISVPYVYYGFRSEGANPQIQYPSVFVEPKSQIPKQVAIGKLDIEWIFAIYWYCRDNEQEQVISQSTFIGQCLVKLLSYNALDDLGGASTRQFQQYPNPAGGYYWLDSDILEIKWGTTFLDPKPSGARFERAARMMLKLKDVISI